MPLINEAAYCVMGRRGHTGSRGCGDELGMNHPMGPLELADFIGLDICVDVMHVLQEGLGDPKYSRVPAAQEIRGRRVAWAEVGRGFYVYSS